MSDAFIETPRMFTSYEFYNNFLPKVNMVDSIDGDLIIDFSSMYKIEPLVIPNLLCLGHIVNSRRGAPARIYIPETNQHGKIKNYLYQIGFTSYAQRYGLYSFINDPYGGLDGRNIDPVCGSIYFPGNSSMEVIGSGTHQFIDPFVDSYLSSFTQLEEGKEGIRYVNLIGQFLTEAVLNCSIHGKSISFTTLHGRHLDGKIYLAISDVGCGFINTIGREKACHSELESIIAGVYKNKNEKYYGLYNVISKVLDHGGKVRIHSNDTQVIFTKTYINEYKNGCLLENPNFIKYNVNHDLVFDGVHVEMELSMNGEDK